jgi:hypothetical protein
MNFTYIPRKQLFIGWQVGGWEKGSGSNVRYALAGQPEDDGARKGGSQGSGMMNQGQGVEG